MPVITKISPQKNGKRINIYLDGKFGFGIDLENFVKLGLKVEQGFETEVLGKIILKAEFQKIYDKILSFAVLRPRSQKEFKNWLKKHKVPSTFHEELLEKLKSLDLLNDKKFATWWVSQRVEFKGKSVRFLELELRQKGISREIIQQVLSEERVDEKQTAVKMLSRKSRAWESFDEFTARRKKSEFLIRNGFSWDVIKEVLDKEE